MHSTSCRQQYNCTGDPVSNSRIWKLDAEVKADVVAFVNAVEDELGVRLRVSQGYRTIEEQNRLYEQGRSTPGPVVTYARGGESNHNFGMAFDVVRLAGGNAVDWTRIDRPIADIARRHGFEWGGAWRKPDYPHFERRR